MSEILLEKNMTICQKINKKDITSWPRFIQTLEIRYY